MRAPEINFKTIWTPMTTALNASGLAMLSDSPIFVVWVPGEGTRDADDGEEQERALFG